ncbi:MAG: DinB family protein [bacterium]|nr:DinB family protein [bacterium]
MIFGLRTTTIALLCALPALGEPLSQQDRETLVSHMEKTRDAFIASVTGLTERQLGYRPSERSWTVFQCAEHITVSEDNMFDEFEAKYLPLAPDPAAKSSLSDKAVLEYGTDREKQKMEASGEYVPNGRWKNLTAMLDHFRTSRERNLELARTTQEDLRGRVHDKIQLDGFQYLLILSAHTQRHTKQIEEIKASPGFPK